MATNKKTAVARRIRASKDPFRPAQALSVSAVRGRFGPPSEGDIGSFFTTAAPAVFANTSRAKIELPLLRDDLIEDRWEEHQVDELRVELCSASRFDDLRRRFGAASVAISSAVGHGIEGIGKGHDPRRQWYAPTFEFVGIAGSIPAFMMREDAFCQIRIEGCERRQNLGAALRMRRDLSSLGGREPGVLVDDVEKRLVDLSDVVKQGDALHDLLLMVGELCRVGDDEGVGGDPSDMRAGLGVVGVDRV